MKLEDFDYPLPKELIAQRPLERRDASRLLVADRAESRLEDKRFTDLVDHFAPGDLLVLNDTKVFPARLLGTKKGTGGKVDLLLLEPAAQAGVWRCLIQPSLRPGQEIELSGAPARCEGRDADGVALVSFDPGQDPRQLARTHGTMPLPPYVKRPVDPQDETAYQTVYAEREGAVAAPTAGLHFTRELLDRLEARQVEIRRLTLHVGYGTFRPVEDLENHRMHAESFELPESTADAVNRARSQKRRVCAVGTTTLRVLETCVRKKQVIPGAGRTDLYIRPPFRFEAVDRLVTNFHLPKTTLLLLVSAFMGEEFRKRAYAHAVESRYRFYSYGDAMLIL